MPVITKVDALVESIRRNQMSREEVEARFADAKPFDPEKWRKQAPPATEEELAEMEAFLPERDEERLRSLAADHREF